VNKTSEADNSLVLTGLEANILQSIEQVGWHAHLWFPVVERKLLNFGSDVPDQEVHAAVVGLVRKGTLVYADPEGWRPPNFGPAPDIRGQILTSPGYMLLVHRMPSIPPGPVEAALEAGFPTDQICSDISATKRDVEQANGENIALTELEAHILQSIDHVGWYAYLWFPVVARESLNFGSAEREENVHAAILGLIQKGELVAAGEEPDDLPQWSPAPGILVAAARTMREVRALQPPPWPDRFSERFHIFAHGETFDVDAFLATSTIHPDYVWRRVPRETSGIEIFLGDGREISLVDQEDLAIAYLKTHRDELRALAQFPGVDTFILGLVWICKPECLGFCVGPSPQLMWQALDIGILPQYYVTIDGRGTDTYGRQE
jgi:hypothetical protein